MKLPANPVRVARGIRPLALYGRGIPTHAAERTTQLRTLHDEGMFCGALQVQHITGLPPCVPSVAGEAQSAPHAPLTPNRLPDQASPLLVEPQADDSSQADESSQAPRLGIDGAMLRRVCGIVCLLLAMTAVLSPSQALAAATDAPTSNPIAGEQNPGPFV